VCLIASASGLMSAFPCLSSSLLKIQIPFFRFVGFWVCFVWRFLFSLQFLLSQFCYFMLLFLICLISVSLLHSLHPRPPSYSSHLLDSPLPFLPRLPVTRHSSSKPSTKSKKRFLCAAAICFVMFQWITFLLSYVVVVFVALRCIWFVFHAICFHVLLNLHASLPSSQNNVYVTKCWQGESFTQFSFLRQTCFATKTFRDTTWMYVFQGNQTFTKLVFTQQVFTAKVYMPHNGRFRMKICYMVFFQ
jgi:hypothetical protein